MLRSRHTVPLLILTLIIGGAMVLVAVFIDWIPAVGSKQAERVDTLFLFVGIVSIAIFTMVTVVVVYCGWRFRVSEDDDTDGPPIHGNTKLEIVWTVVPAILLAIMAVWAYLVLSDNEALANDRLVIDVTAQQFAWQFVNPEAGAASADMRVPAGRQVQLKMRSKDVIHDFYVKEFRVKQDIVPGITTSLVFNPTRVGTFQVMCAELCGVGHGTMRARVIVMEPAAYQQWVTQTKADVAQQQAAQQQNQGQGGGASTAPSTTAPAPAPATP